MFALVVLVAPAAAAVFSPAQPTGGAPPVPAADPSEPAPLYDGRLADGLAEEPPTATVSILVRLSGGAISDVILDYRARFGDQSAWPAPVVDSARGAVEARNASLGRQRDSVMASLALAGIQTDIVRDYRYLVNGFNLRNVPAVAAVLLAANREVAFVERDQQVFVALAQSVPLINADDVWNFTDGLGRNMTGYGSLIANIDTGVDYSHPDLGGTLNRTNDLANLTAGTHPKFAAGWDFVNNDADPWDGHLHGTHVAGIIGANGTVRGVAPNSKQLALKVLSDAGYGGDSDIIAAMQYATNPDGNALTNDAANASSMSIGGWDPNPDGLEPLAADQSARLGTLCIIAAGNDGATNSVGSPGVSRLSITVGSTTKSDVLSGFSSRGPTLGLDLKPDLVAPGSSIVSTRWGGAGGTLTLSGTSMATPHVSGAVALIAQAHRNWTVNQTKSALVDTAADIGLGVFQQGGGRLDVAAAVNASALASPHKVVMGRLARMANLTNTTVTIENVAAYNVSLNLSVKDLFGMNPDFTTTGNTADLDYVTVSPSSVSLSPGGRANITLTFAPPSSAVPGLYWGTLTAAGGNASLRIPLTYAVRSPILLVDDDSSERYLYAPAFDNFAGFPSATNNLSASLTRLGFKHDIFTAVHYTDDGAPLSELTNYPLVIWATGYDYDYSDGFHTHRSISANDRAALSSYLDRGGQLWLIGENIAWDVFSHQNATVGSSNFFNAYLGVARVDNELNTPNPLTGTPGTFMAGASYTVNPTWTDYGNRGDYATNLTPTSRGFTIFNASTTDVYGKTYSNASLAVAVDNATYRSVYWGTEFSFLSTNANFDDAVGKTLAFFRPRVLLANATAEEGQNLSFAGAFGFLPSESVFAFAWNFGDNGTATSRNATHTFADEGNYTIRFTVTSGAWLNLSGTLNLTVLNAAPTVDNATSAPAQPREGQLVNFSAACSDAGVLDTVSYSWSFGDATPNATGATPAHTYADEGNYSVTVACADNDGGVTLWNFSLDVANAVPVVTGASINGNFLEGDLLSFWAVCTDPGVNDSVWVIWAFGDGVDANTSGNTTHVYLDDGFYTATLSCYDNDGGLNRQTFGFTVSNVAPSVWAAANYTVDEGSPLQLNATVTDPGVNDTMSYLWDFGDGTSTSTAPVPNHTWIDNGVFLVRLNVTDNGGAVGRAAIVITVRNVAPIVQLEVYGDFTEGSPFLYNLTVEDPGANDRIHQSWDYGQAVTSWGVWADEGSYAVTYHADDEDGGSTIFVVYVVIANAAPTVIGGTSPPPATENETIPFNVSVADAGPWDELNVTYDFGDGSPAELVLVRSPSSDPKGRVSHSYWAMGNYTVRVTVEDGDGGNSSTSFNVTVVNRAPTLDVSPTYRTISEGATVNFHSGAEDDGLHGALNVTWTFSDDGTTVFERNVAHQFRNNGRFKVHVSATDNLGVTVFEDMEFLVTNAAPTLVVSGPHSVKQLVEWQFAAETSDAGPDDSVQVTWTWPDGPEEHGLVLNHSFQDPGPFTVEVRAVDSDGAQTLVLWSVTVENQFPVLNGINFNGLWREGTNLSFEADLAAPSSEQLVYLWDFGDGEFSTLAAPSHIYADQGEYAVELTILEPDGVVAAANRTMYIDNAVPVVSCPTCPERVGQGTPFVVSLVARDPGTADWFTYTLELPDGAILNSVNGNFTVTLPKIGKFYLVARVADDEGATDQRQIGIEVLPDTDHDGEVDQVDLDDDNDGVPDAQDPAPQDASIREAGIFGSWLWLLLLAAAVVGVFLVLRRSRKREPV